MSSPTTGDQICAQYKLSHDDFAAMPANIRALYRAAYACDVLHVQEVPIGSNRGPDVERYLAVCGLPGGNPWCAAFGTCMLVDSGVSLVQLPKGPSATHDWIHWAEDNGLTLETPVRGCAGIIWESATSGHFILVSHDLGDGHVASLEGNSNSDGSSEGYAVVRHIRPYSQIHTWVDLSHLTS